MGKKDKDREKGKKGKPDSNKGDRFTVPKPPPWPLPGAITRPVSAALATRPQTTANPAAPLPPVAAPPASERAAAGAPESARPPLTAPVPVGPMPIAELPDHEFDIEMVDMADFSQLADYTDFTDIADIAPLVSNEPIEDSVSSSAPPSVDIEPPEEDAALPTVDDLTEQIRDLEARLDQLLDESRATVAPAPGRSSSPPLSRPSDPAARAADLEWTDPAPAPAASPPEGASHDFLSSQFYLRKWGKAGMRQRAEEVDEFGFDPAYDERVRPFIDFLYRLYFRVDTQGVSHIPAEGRCVVVANHAGGPLPYDGLMLRAAIRREHASRRDLRWLTEDFVFYLPFVGASLNRLGAVRACQENAERLLSRERLIGVFPEGAKGIGKLFGERYRLQRFGRGGFIRLCLRTGTPIIPCAIVGAEEANPTVYRVEALAKLVGLPYLPVTPTFPALGPVGLLPAPSKWKIRFGAPIRLTTYGPEAADDDLLVARLAEGVRAVIQEMLNDMLAKRRSIWFG